MSDISRLEQQADLLMENVAGWERSTLARIGKRIDKYGKMSLADVKAINNIAVVNQDFEAITKELAKVTGYNISQIEQMYADLLAEQHLENKPLYDYRNKPFLPFSENIELQALARAYAKATGETMINLAKTKALCVLDRNGNVKGLKRYYTDVLDKAVMNISSGAIDFRTAMRDSIVELGGSGVRIDYGGGVTRRLDTAVRQNLLWGAKQASVAYNEIVGEEIGCDGIEIDWHSFPRPSHEFMQGKQYVLGKARTINGTYFESADRALEALEDYGCLHFKTPIICGVSEPRYSPQELKRLNEQNARTFVINGKEMTGYEASQAMRRLETEVRKQKDIRAIARESGEKEQVRRCNARIKACKAKYAEISDITGIAQEPKRMSVPRMPKTDGNSLTSAGDSGIIIKSNNVGEKAEPYPSEKVPQRIRTYLSKLQKSGDKIEIDSPISFEDIALMSRQTGCEFASFTVGQKSYVLLGDENGTYIPKDFLNFLKLHKGKFNCHSHPYIGDLQPSESDIELANIMSWQNRFYIITPDMKKAVYTKNGVLEIDDVRSIYSSDDIKILEEIFGG